GTESLHLVEEDLRRDRAGADERVAQLHGTPERVRMMPAEPERRVRLLQRLGLHRRVLELEELAVHGDPRLGPEPLPQPEPFGEARGPALSKPSASARERNPRSPRTSNAPARIVCGIATPSRTPLGTAES